MKTLSAVLFGLITSTAFGQKNDQDIPSWDFIYGFRTLNRPMFGKGVERKYSTFSDFQWSQPLQFVGVGLTLNDDFTGETEKYFIGNMQIEAYLPQRMSVNDSLTVKSRGFNVGMTFFGVDAFPQSAHFDLIFNLGFDAGRILLTNPGIYQRNLYFAPKISIQPKVKMGPLVLSVFAEYGYDLTRDNWKKTWFGPRHQNNLPAYSNKIGGMSGLSWFVTVGYALPFKEN